MRTAKMDLNAMERKDKPEKTTANTRERELDGEEGVLCFLETAYGEQASQWAGVLSYRDKNSQQQRRVSGGQVVGGGRGQRLCGEGSSGSS